VTLVIDNVGEVPGRIVAAEANVLRVAFGPLASAERENLIGRLFTGACHNTVERVGLGRLLLALIRRAFGRPIEGRPQPASGRLFRPDDQGRSASA
jgi:hypothetical protein